MRRMRKLKLEHAEWEPFSICNYCCTCLFKGNSFCANQGSPRLGLLLKPMEFKALFCKTCELTTYGNDVGLRDRTEQLGPIKTCSWARPKVHQLFITKQ